MSYNIHKNESIAPRLTWNRFDLAFKMAYLEELDKGIFEGFGKECYAKHIDAFSLGDFSEPGNPNKNSLKKYLDVFEELNTDIKTNGFDIDKGKIPLATDGSILNGAHRTTIGLYHNFSLPIKFTNKAPQEFDYKYFKSRGLNEEYLDFGALKYLENSKDIYLAIIWPRANCQFKDVEYLFNNVIYSKKVKLNYNGAHNLLVEAYEGEIWLGNKNKNYPGIKNKLIECFPNFNSFYVCLFHEESVEKVLHVKNNIREKFKVGKHAVHITDNDNESYSLAKLLFNSNSIHYLNNARPNSFEISVFNEYGNITTDCRDIELPILGPDFTLRLYGFNNLEVINDFDGKAFKSFSVKSEMQNLKLFPPSYYFYHKGLKCIALQEVIKNYGRISNIPLIKRVYIKFNMLYKLSMSKVLNDFFCNVSYLNLKYKIKSREKLGLLIRFLGVKPILKKAIFYFRRVK
jgi:hypothetical protein